MPMRDAVIYCRISQDREGGGLGVERQRNDCEALAKTLGWSVVEVFTDNDVSAYSGKKRPGYTAMLEALRDGRANAVLVWHTDRLHRSPVELEAYVDICEPRKIVTQTVQAGELDLATPSGRMVARMLGAAARYEVEHKSARTKRAQQQAATDGKWLGGAQPIGWNLKKDGSATLDRKAANRIRRATTDVVAGVSLGSIVAAWNAEGFTTGAVLHGCEDKAACIAAGHRRGVDCPSRREGEWNYTSLRQVLTRARNAGKVEYNGEIVADSHWPAIVTVNQWRAVVAILSDPSRRRSTTNRAKWLLAGIAVCGKKGCGARLKTASVGMPKGGRRTIYRCAAPGTGHVARDAVSMNDYVEGVVVAWLAKVSAPGLIVAGDDAADSEDEALAIRARLLEVAQSYAKNQITLPQLTLITEGLTDQLRVIDEASASSGRRALLTDFHPGSNVQVVWNSLGLDRQRAIIKAFVGVTVLPSGRRGKGFDHRLVSIEWPT